MSHGQCANAQLILRSTHYKLAPYHPVRTKLTRSRSGHNICKYSKMSGGCCGCNIPNLSGRNQDSSSNSPKNKHSNTSCYRNHSNYNVRQSNRSGSGIGVTNIFKVQWLSQQQIVFFSQGASGRVWESSGRNPR